MAADDINNRTCAKCMRVLKSKVGKSPGSGLVEKNDGGGKDFRGVTMKDVSIQRALPNRQREGLVLCK